MLGLAQTVLVHDDMETVHLRGESFRDLNREGLGRLRQQRAIDVTVRDPDDLSVVIVETGDHMRNVDRFSALIEQSRR